jgi:hypothetical protein
VPTNADDGPDGISEENGQSLRISLGGASALTGHRQDARLVRIDAGGHRLLTGFASEPDLKPSRPAAKARKHETGGAHSGNSQSTFQGCLDRLAIANPCYERGVAYINATATTLIHRLTRLIPLKPEVRSIVVSTSAFESEGHWFESTLES